MERGLETGESGEGQIKRENNCKNQLIWTAWEWIDPRWEEKGEEGHL